MSYEKKVKDTQSVLNFLNGKGSILVNEYLKGKDSNNEVSYSEMVDKMLSGGTTEDNVCFDSSSIIRGDITEFLLLKNDELKSSRIAVNAN